MRKTSLIKCVGGSMVLGLLPVGLSNSVRADDMTKPVVVAPDSTKTDAVPLQAIFMDLSGKVRWRASESAPWSDAKVNDILDPGAEIRTGLKSRAVLRVGKNATILVDAGTTCKLPEIVQDGQTLRTLASVKSGRADFKVDHVGFANDFKVVTPQTTLSVRGTGFSITSSPLKGVDISGARTNTINAVEVKYVASNLPYFVSGQGKSSSESGKRDPVQNAWVSTVGPPPIAGTLVNQTDVQQQVAQGAAGVNAGSNSLQVQQSQKVEAKEVAIDKALVLASVGSNGGDASNVYLRFQNEARDTKDKSVVDLRQGEQAMDLSKSQLASFNQNFDEVESGRWNGAVNNLKTLWGPSTPGQGGGSGGGVNQQLVSLQTRAAADLQQSQANLNAMSFDSSRYFVYDFAGSGEGAGASMLTDAAFHDGELLNGSGESLLSLQQRWSSEGALIQQAIGLNTSVQNAFQLVSNSYSKLLTAEQALNGMASSNGAAKEIAASLKTDLAKMDKYLVDLKELVGTSTSQQSKEAISSITALSALVSNNVAAGLLATQNAMDNYKNASSRATKALFLAEAAKYRDAVAISLQSIAYLTQASQNGGSEGIAVLAAKIQENFNQANGQFSYQSFRDFAQLHVDDASTKSAVVQGLASLSRQYAQDAESELTGSNLAAINSQLSTMQTQVNLMSTKYGTPDGQGNYQVGTLGNYQAKSFADLASSNAHKASFDQLFANGATQGALSSDFNALKALSDLYCGSNSIQSQANNVYGQISGHYDNVLTASNSINGLTANYNSKLQQSDALAAQSQNSFQQNLADSKAGATRYLNDFKTIVGNNNTEVARAALEAVTQLVNEHNAYVDNAASAVAGALCASQRARSRGDMVYYNAVAQQLERAATIQLAADNARLAVITNGSVIQSNYNQASGDYHSLDPKNPESLLLKGGSGASSGSGKSGSASTP